MHFDGNRWVEVPSRPVKRTKSPSKWYFETSCVNANGDDIQDMAQHATRITYNTLLRQVGKPFLEMQRELGYDVGGMRGGLRMEPDFNVSYHKSVYKDEPCYYFRWSGIEHIFLKS